MLVPGLSNIEGGLQQTDVVFDDNGWPWKLSEIDRPIPAVHSNFAQALGPDGSPLQVGIDLARQEGREDIHILEVGGGTGHSMRTLIDAIALGSAFSKGRIHGTILDRNDFSQKSLSAKTRGALASGSIEYLVGLAEDLPYQQTPDNYYDMVFAYESLIYIRRPQDVVPRLMQLARPAGHVLFNAMGERARQIDTRLGQIAQDWDIDHATVECPDARGKVQTRAFYHLTKPA